MRFSTSRISISDRMKPSTFSRRSAGLVISSSVCLSSSLMPRWATIVSASRAGSSIDATDMIISGGIFLFSLT